MLTLLPVLSGHWPLHGTHSQQAHAHSDSWQAMQWAAAQASKEQPHGVLSDSMQGHLQWRGM